MTTLAALEARHASARLRAQAVIRSDARRLAARLGLEVPEWARLLPRTAEQRSRAATAPRARRPERLPPPGTALELPPALLRWRSLAGDHGVSVSADGSATLRRGSVRLGTAQAATFATVDAAAKAVEPVLPWRRVGAPVDKRQGSAWR